MKVLLSWLKNFIDLNVPPEEIGKTLTMLGMEVEKITGDRPSFKDVIVGKVLEAKPHPNASRLRIAIVTDGKQTYQIVCGAPNCREGIVVALAQVGAILTDENQNPFVIKKTSIRGVESMGMLCSAQELNLTEESDAILELDFNCSLGEMINPYVLDPVFDISLTPNLGHCSSVLGIARELSSAYQIPLKPLSMIFKEEGRQKMEISVEDPQLCPLYYYRIITDIQGFSSPQWLQNRLLASGINPTNTVVDVANYVMLEIGQPLHIVDLDTLSSQQITISALNKDLPFVSLDGKNRMVPQGAIVVMNGSIPLAVAGIIGSLETAVKPTTQNILIESAAFSAQAIRKTSRLLGLKTEASQRFDKGIDAGNLVEALNRASQLIQEFSRGKIHSLGSFVSKPVSPTVIPCRFEKIESILGFHLTRSEMISLLTRLAMSVQEHPQGFEVTVPTYRNDLKSEIDIIEEIARLYGYENIPRQPSSYRPSSLLNTPVYELEQKAKHLLLNEGLQECITCDLISPELCHKTMEKRLTNENFISVLHPRSVDQSVLRPSLLPGLLETLQHNLNHQVGNLSIFEIGRIHFKNGITQDKRPLIVEPSCLGILLTGKSRPYHFDPKPAAVDFFDLKGIIENLCEGLLIRDQNFLSSHLHTLHPGRQAKIDCQGVTIGVFGEIHPKLLQEFSISQKVLFAELNLDDILSLKNQGISYSPIPNFPSSERDWTITVKEEISLKTVSEAIITAKSPFLESFYLLDLYHSPYLGEGLKNLTLRFVYRDLKQTLSFDTVETEHQRLTHSVAQKLQN